MQRSLYRSIHSPVLSTLPVMLYMDAHAAAAFGALQLLVTA